MDIPYCPRGGLCAGLEPEEADAPLLSKTKKRLLKEKVNLSKPPSIRLLSNKLKLYQYSNRRPLNPPKSFFRVAGRVSNQARPPPQAAQDRGGLCAGLEPEAADAPILSKNKETAVKRKSQPL
jgi:hypothetical protein